MSVVAQWCRESVDGVGAQAGKDADAWAENSWLVPRESCYRNGRGHN